MRAPDEIDSVRGHLGLAHFEWSWIAPRFKVTGTPADRLLDSALRDEPTLVSWIADLQERRPARADVLDHILARAAGLDAGELWVQVEHETMFVLHTYVHALLNRRELVALQKLLSKRAWAVVTDPDLSNRGTGTLAQHVVGAVLGVDASTVRRRLADLRNTRAARLLRRKGDARRDPPGTLVALVERHGAAVNAIPPGTKSLKT